MTIRWIAIGSALLLFVGATAAYTQTPPTGSEAVLDRVVAVVNNRAILASDVASEQRFAVLDPEKSGRDQLPPKRALQLLISRALIQQQIRQEDATVSEPSSDEVRARLAELRKELPACVRAQCATDDGWSVFLATNGLIAEQVEAYLRLRLEVLRFIQTRFSQGIRISPQETEGYYRDKLLPQYAQGQPAPPLETVAPRIEEILLQQQVNVMFSAWLDNLRKQGDVEVLDPSLESAADAKDGLNNEGEP
ncbi:MAG TPA: peptidylprolyl isomerase [Terracidiphilus sp.]